MSTAEVPRPGEELDGPVRDIVLNDDDRYALIVGISETFSQPGDAERLLVAIRFPEARRPNFEFDVTRAWNQVFTDLDHGILPPNPYATILLAALRVYSDHPVLRRLAERHGLVPVGRPRAAPDPVQPPSPDQPPEEAAPPPEGCHVIIRADNEDERRYAVARLRELGLDPHEVWSTGAAVSYLLTVDDPGIVRERLERSDLGWTVVAPGQPDYLYLDLFVEGPDTRRFVVRGAPAQQPVGDVASEILADYYPRPGGASVPIAVDHIPRDGQTRRIDGDSTLHDAGVRDGDTLRIQYQVMAGGPPRMAVPGTVRVHVFIASSTNRALLRGNAELREIQACAEFGHIAVTLSTAARLLDLRAVLTTRPGILHLSAHGQSGGLVFDGELGEAVLVPAVDIVRLLSMYRDKAGLRLAGLVLNSGNSAEIAEQFRDVADVVVAHRGQLDDDCAVTFARQLYATLRQIPDLAAAACIAAEHVSRATGVCAETSANLVVLTGREPE